MSDTITIDVSSSKALMEVLRVCPHAEVRTVPADAGQDAWKVTMLIDQMMGDPLIDRLTLLEGRLSDLWEQSAQDRGKVDRTFLHLTQVTENLPADRERVSNLEEQMAKVVCGHVMSDFQKLRKDAEALRDCHDGPIVQHQREALRKDRELNGD